MAEVVAEGAKEAGADVSLLTCAEVNGISAYDAVALGSPAMGAEELEDSEFLPMLEGIEPALPGKESPCSAPTSGATANGCAPGRRGVRRKESHWLRITCVTKHPFWCRFLFI